MSCCGKSYCYPIWVSLLTNLVCRIFLEFFSRGHYYFTEDPSYFLEKKGRGRSVLAVLRLSLIVTHDHSQCKTQSDHLPMLVLASQMCGFKDWNCHLICGEMLRLEVAVATLVMELTV